VCLGEREAAALAGEARDPAHGGGLERRVLGLQHEQHLDVGAGETCRSVLASAAVEVK
jgi:hypothetical protein